MKDMRVSDIIAFAPNPRKGEAEALQAKARSALEGTLTSVGEDIGGFAILVFDRKGDASTGVNHDFLPWGRTPMATFAYDALALHCARGTTKEDREDPDGGFLA